MGCTDPWLPNNGDTTENDNCEAYCTGLSTTQLHATGDGCEDQNVITWGLASAGDGGGGHWYWDDTQDKANANLGTIIDPSVAFSTAVQGTGVGTGCWVREYSDGRINALWFGADPTDSSDSTTAIQAAIDAAGTGGVVLPYGTYYISDTLDAPCDLVGLESTLRQTTQDDMILVLADKVTIKDLRFQGINDIGGGIEIKADKCSVLNNYFTNFGHPTNSSGVAVRAEGSVMIYNALVDGNFFENSEGITNSDISFGYRTQGVIVTNNTCLGSNDCGVSLNAVAGDGECIVTNNIIKNKRRHGVIAQYDSSSSLKAKTIVANNYIYNTGWTGVYMIGTTGTDNGEVTISNNHIRYCGGTEVSGLQGGITVSGTRGAVITGNLIVASGKDTDNSNRLYACAGIRLLAQTAKMLVANNQVKDCYGMGIMANGLRIDRVLIDANQITDCTNYGIYLEPATNTTALDKAVISNNAISSIYDTTTGIRVNVINGATINDLRVVGNYLAGTTGANANSGISFRFTESYFNVCEIMNNRVTGFDSGIENSSYIAGRVVGFRLKIKDNFISYCTNGLSLAPVGSDWLFTISNTFYSNTSDRGGVALSFDADSVVDGVVTFKGGTDPSTGGATWVVGDTWHTTSPTAGGYLGKICTVAGAPGTWKSFGAIVV